MMASILRAQGEIVTDAVEVPTPADDQVLIRIAAVGVCGSDIHYFHEGRIGDFVVDAPLILGHEASGTIVAVGADVDAGRIGQRVAIEPQRPCRRCEQCRSGRYNLCTSIEFYATPPIDGAFAEYAAIQSDFAYAIPDSMSFDAAALCEPLSVGIWTAQKAGIRPGSSVLIAGAGPIGIITAQVARAFGATRVIVSDPVAERRAVALRFGATEVVDPIATDIAAAEWDVDAFIDASGAAPAIRAGVYAVGPAGRVVLVGMGADEAPLPLSRIQNRELVVTGVFRYANTYPTAIALIEKGLVDLDSLVTHRFGLGEVVEALEAAGDPSALKVIVAPGEEG
ncbi:MAG: NAD(P)-dependent alcohol dehydrogenase [Microbacterium sp.]